MSETLKTVKDVFPDYETDTIIAGAKIKNANLYKKINQLSLTLIIENRINLVNIYKFENYLKIRFKVKDARIIIENVPEIKIQTEWENITRYINSKYPITRAILINSKPILDNNVIKVMLAVKGKEFLEKSGFEKILEQLLNDFFNKKYKVQYEEELDTELIKKYEENTKRVERMAIELAEQEISVELENEKEKNKKEEQSKKQENENKKEVVKAEQPIEKNIKEEEKEVTPLILGRSMMIKTPLIKVEDLTVDSGSITLEGEIINMDSRELKSGKFLLMFDLFDGSSTITCKSFVPPEKLKEVSGRLKRC